MTILHRTRTLTALLPRYVSRFSCIGPSCEDNCCSGWQVALDKKTFKAYRQASHPALAAVFDQHIKRQQVNSSELDYGRIALTPGTDDCPLMQDKLCSVQRHLDESHLSHTCFTYPRVSRDFGGQHQQALLLSCPEAARQALLAPDAFDFIEGPITVRPDLVHAAVSKHGLALERMNELRIFCLQLVRADGLALWQRLALLGVFCEKLSQALAAGQQDRLPALLDDFAALVEQGQVLETLDQLQPDYPAQALVFSTLWGGKPFVATSPLRNEIVNRVALGLGADPASGRVAGDQLVEAYRRGVARLPQALEAAPHLLDHYILNEMFVNFFPFDAEDPYDDYLQLVSRFGVLRLMLAGLCNSAGPLPDAATLVLTVQTHCRRFQHDAAFAQRVNQAMGRSGLGKLEKVFTFLRT